MDGKQSRSLQRVAIFAVLAAILSGCGGFGSSILGDDGPGESSAEREAGNNNQRTSTLGDLFAKNDDPNVTLEVNKYLWAASLDVLSFLPIQTADPFSGLIVTGYGTPPGGSRAYRATILIQDPALEARSLNVSLSTRAGTAPTQTVRAVEDAILTRARQLRIRDLDL